jgi:hypothetical protein
VLWNAPKMLCDYKTSGHSTTMNRLPRLFAAPADPAKVDKRTRSKWSRVLRYAMQYKDHSDPLERFIKRKGGINECASRFARLMGVLRGTRFKKLNLVK